MKRIYAIGTADTKGAELEFLADALRSHNAAVCTVDVGILQASFATDVTASEVAASGDPDLLQLRDRGAAVSAMAGALANFLKGRNDIAGVVGIGGGGGTSIITNGMRALPLGIPKLMVSTLASGDTSAFVGPSDIVMMPSISDLAGLNRISRMVLSNAAAAIAAMSAQPLELQDGKPAVGLTMFGVTTVAVTQVLKRLDPRYEGVAFHATGTGGKAMEGLVDSGLLSAVIDITTTEIADLLFGGVLPAGPDRLDCIARTKVPYIGSVGACDMINFWAPSTVPAQHSDRLFYHHNDNVTLMRTSAAECAEIGRWIATKLNACDGEVEFLIPEKGVSALDIEGGAFYDREADKALFDAIESTGNWTGKRRLTRLPLHINEPEFADAVARKFSQMIS